MTMLSSPYHEKDQWPEAQDQSLAVKDGREIVVGVWKKRGTRRSLARRTSSSISWRPRISCSDPPHMEHLREDVISLPRYEGRESRNKVPFVGPKILAIGDSADSVDPCGSLQWSSVSTFLFAWFHRSTREGLVRWSEDLPIMVCLILCRFRFMMSIFLCVHGCSRLAECAGGEVMTCSFHDRWISNVGNKCIHASSSC
jgi:hypothetical protein